MNVNFARSAIEERAVEVREHWNAVTTEDLTYMPITGIAGSWLLLLRPPLRDLRKLPGACTSAEFRKLDPRR
jgi:hypothetical protein